MSDPRPSVWRRFARVLSRAARQAATGARRRPMLPLASFGTLAICVLLGGIFALAAWNVGRLTAKWSGESHMTVYLDDETSSQRAAQITDAVRHLPGVTEAKLVSPKEAHARLRASLGTRGDLLDGVDDALLPASIDVRLRPGVGGLLRATPAFAKLEGAAGVESVDLHAETTERLDRARVLAVQVAVALGLLVALATIYMVAATIRLGVEARRDELSVLRLVGATEGFVRAPFLLEGIVTGTLGAAVALGILWCAFRAAGPRLVEVLGSWLSAAPISFFSPVACVGIVMGGALLGLAGAGAAFSREAA